MDNPDTVALDLALEGAGDSRGGFPLADVVLVEACWSLVDANLASYGFIVELVDGTRRYLELTLDDMNDEHSAEFELLDLGESTGLPELPDTKWQTDVEHLNRRLAQLKRQ